VIARHRVKDGWGLNRREGRGRQWLLGQVGERGLLGQRDGWGCVGCMGRQGVQGNVRGWGGVGTREGAGRLRRGDRRGGGWGHCGWLRRVAGSHNRCLGRLGAGGRCGVGWPHWGVRGGHGWWSELGVRMQSGWLWGQSGRGRGWRWLGGVVGGSRDGGLGLVGKMHVGSLGQRSTRLHGCRWLG
jgi:hypothetical protein